MIGQMDTFELHSNKLCGDVPTQVAKLERNVTNDWSIETGNDLGTPCCEVRGGASSDTESIPTFSSVAHLDHPTPSYPDPTEGVHLHTDCHAEPATDFEPDADAAADTWTDGLLFYWRILREWLVRVVR